MSTIVADDDCVAFLQWALPRLGRRWDGYRKVRRRVCRVIWRRVGELDLPSLAEYRRRLEHDPAEWVHLDRLVDVTISRFYRDRSVFDHLRSEILPLLVRRARAAGRDTVHAWCTGCACGEEPYTLSVMWDLCVAEQAGGVGFDVLATDVKPVVLRRAREARYPPSSVRDLPQEWRAAAFRGEGEDVLLTVEHRRRVRFVEHDVRDAPPGPPAGFDLILCRYQAFTYFDEAGRRSALDAFARVTRPGAVLVLGRRETVPEDEHRFTPLSATQSVFERTV